MMKKIILVLMMFWATWGFSADFNVDFQRKYKEMQAESLFSKKQYAEARQAFDKFAATAKTPIDKAMWQARAAIAVGLQENRFTNGLELAKSIGEKPYSVQAQMELMTAKKDYKGLIEAFGEEDIAAWPARPIPRKPRCPEADACSCALFDRGNAYIEIGNGQAAEKDLEKAEEFALSPNRKFYIWRAQAKNQTQLLKNEEKAFEANLKIAVLNRGSADYFRGVIGAADYLRKQSKYDEALKILDKMDPYNKQGYWLGAGLSAVGRTLADAGRTDKAIAAYRQIVEDKSATTTSRSAALLAIGDTCAAAGRTDEAIAAYKELLAYDKAHARYKDKAKEALKNLGHPAE